MGGEADGAGQALLESSVCCTKQLSFLPRRAGRFVAREEQVLPKEKLHKNICLIGCKFLEGMAPSWEQDLEQ